MCSCVCVGENIVIVFFLDHLIHDDIYKKIWAHIRLFTHIQHGTVWNNVKQHIGFQMITTTTATTTTIEYERIVFLGEIPVPFIGIMFHIYIQRRYILL